VGRWSIRLLRFPLASSSDAACGAVAAGEGQYGAILWVKPGDVQKAARVLGAAK